MSKRSRSLILLAAAVVLAGLGHYYLLFLRTYIWDIVVFYVAAALLLAWAWRRADGIPERSWALLQSALRQLGAALRGLLFRRPNRLLVVVLALANGLAALVILLVPWPVGLLLALLLWVSGVAVLGILIPRPRRATPEPAPSASSAVSLEIPKARPERYAIPLAIAGWLLLVAGLVILGLDGAPSPCGGGPPSWRQATSGLRLRDSALLRTLNAWLEPRLAGLHADLPVPPGVWVPGSLLSLIGMILIGWAGAGVGTLSDTPSLTIRTSPLAIRSRPSQRWYGLALVGGLIWLGVVYTSTVSSLSWSVIPLWLVALVIPAACWWRMDRARGVSIPPLWRPARVKRSTWLIVPALVIAFSVTLYRLADVPNSIWGDEGAFWTLARDLAQGVRVNPFDLGVYAAFPVISSLYQSLWIKLLGPTLWSWRLASVVIGTLTIVPLFFLTRKLLGTRVAWSAVVLMVSMPYFLAYARIGFNSIQPLLPITLGLWLLIEAVHQRSRLLAYLAGAACGMASLTYMSGHVGLVVAGLIGVFLFVDQRPLRRLLVKLLPPLLIGWLFAAGPFVLGCVLGGKSCGSKVAESYFGNAFYGQAIFSLEKITRLYPLWQVGQHEVFFEPGLYALLVGRGLIRTALSMVMDGVATQHYLVGPLVGPGVIFFLAGFGWLLSRWRRLPAALWMVWIAVCAALLSALNTFPPRTAHMAPIVPALAVVTAVGIWLLVDLLWPLVRSRWVNLVGVVLTAALALLGLRAYFVVMPQRYVPNLENVMFWRAREMERGSTLVFVADEPYSSEFRVWGIDEFDLEVDYHNVPAEEVQAADFRALCERGCRVFFLPQNADAVEAQLRAQLGEVPQGPYATRGGGTVRTHVDAQGRTIGLEFVPD